jgi:hypothetical protein
MLKTDTKNYKQNLIDKYQQYVGPTLKVIMVLILVIGSFLLGKSQTTRIDVKKEQTQYNQIQEQKEVIAILAKKATTFEELGLKFIKDEDDKQTKECPEEFPIKIKLDKQDPRFYSQSNKSFKKVNPDMCGKSKTLLEAIGFKEV